jgi:CarD family transcriptional regulator
MFKIGDRVIYPNQGLAIIEDIQEAAYDGVTLKIYHLRICANNTLVLVPFSSATEMGIRKPILENSVRKIFSYIKSADFDISADWKGRYKEHLNLMKSGTILDLIAVLKSLYYLSRIKTLSFREKKMMDKAKELIVTEISEASCTPLDEVEHKVISTLSRCYKAEKADLGI